MLSHESLANYRWRCELESFSIHRFRSNILNISAITMLFVDASSTRLPLIASDFFVSKLFWGLGGNKALLSDFFWFWWSLSQILAQYHRGLRFPWAPGRVQIFEWVWPFRSLVSWLRSFLSHCPFYFLPPPKFVNVSSAISGIHSFCSWFCLMRTKTRSGRLFFVKWYQRKRNTTRRDDTLYCSYGHLFDMRLQYFL